MLRDDKLFETEYANDEGSIRKVLKDTLVRKTLNMIDIASIRKRGFESIPEKIKSLEKEISDLSIIAKNKDNIYLKRIEKSIEQKQKEIKRIEVDLSNKEYQDNIKKNEISYSLSNNKEIRLKYDQLTKAFNDYVEEELTSIFGDFDINESANYMKIDVDVDSSNPYVIILDQTEKGTEYYAFNSLNLEKVIEKDNIDGALSIGKAEKYKLLINGKTNENEIKYNSLYKILRKTIRMDK